MWVCTSRHSETRVWRRQKTRTVVCSPTYSHETYTTHVVSAFSDPARPPPTRRAASKRARRAARRDDGPSLKNDDAVRRRRHVANRCATINVVGRMPSFGASSWPGPVFQCRRRARTSPRRGAGRGCGRTSGRAARTRRRSPPDSRAPRSPTRASKLKSRPTLRGPRRPPSPTRYSRHAR